MEAFYDRPPEYAHRSPQNVVWPAVPQHTLEPHLHASDITLPDLKTVLSADFEQLSPRESSIGSPPAHIGSPTSVRSLPRIDPGYATFKNDTRQSVDAIMASPTATASVMSAEDRTHRSTSVSMDDPDVRSAVEGLAGLGNPDFVCSTRGQNLQLASHANPTARAAGRTTEPEPLLELVSQAHPWVGGTIKGSLSVYSTTKYYSPRIVQYGVSLLERNIGSPVVSAVGSVSAYTGVEAGLRRHLDSRRSHDLERGLEKSNGFFADSPMDIDVPDAALVRPRTEQLPPYGASRPPSYREEVSPASSDRKVQKDRPSNNRSWSSQVVYTASGLSVALSATSRQSLQFCLRLLAQQTGYVNHLTKALNLLLNNYEEARQRYHNQEADLEKGGRPGTPEQDENARELANQIKKHCDDIWRALQYVVNSVSNSAGGALPQNAREFVRVQLMSLPQRWRVVSDATSGESETSRTAQRMINFAGQGLDMMTQVSGVLQATLESAERWLAAVGRSDHVDESMTDAQSLSAFPEKAHLQA